MNGDAVTRPIAAGLMSSDEQRVYPIADGIVILLPDLAISTTANDSQVGNHSTQNCKQSVQAFYDQIGWQQSDGGAFADADIFEDLRPVSKDYIHNCHLRVKHHLDNEGTYLLDAASGPIQYPAYLTYSENYTYRICADISIVALKAAKRKIGDKGIYLLCDVVHLPLKDDTVSFQKYYYTGGS